MIYQLIWTFLPSSRKAISCCVQRLRICHIKKLRIKLFDNFNYCAVIINNCGTRWLVNFMIWYLTSCVSTQCGGLAATILQFTIYSFYVDTRSHNWFGVAARDNSDTDCTAARGHWHTEIPGDNGGVEGEMNFYCFHHFHRYHSHLITLSLSQLHTPPWAYVHTRPWAGLWRCHSANPIRG